MERVILHSDLNNFYASVECLYAPQLRTVPMAVAGDETQRHGIVLAKNIPAKKYGIQTGDTLWQARKKCADIVFVAPHFDRYMLYSKRVRKIYDTYSDMVEPFGMDECWIDVGGSATLFGDGKTIADDIRARVKTETGLTVSVGVSFNKIFAKLASDMRKPDATTCITEENFKELVWPLPAEDLLYVGRMTIAALHKHYMYTIGDIAMAQESDLQAIFGKNGSMLYRFANGLDRSPVQKTVATRVPKSVSNGITLPRDLVRTDEVRLVLYALSEEVGARLRSAGLVAGTIHIAVRDSVLASYTRQVKLPQPTASTAQIAGKAFALYMENRSTMPVRSLSVAACQLQPYLPQQLSMFAEGEDALLDTVMDYIRSRYGNGCVGRGIGLLDTALYHVAGAAFTPAFCNIEP